MKFPIAYQQCKDIRRLDAEPGKEETGSDRLIRILASDETPIERFSWSYWGSYWLTLSHNPDAVNLNRVDNQVCCFFENHPGLFSDSTRIGKVMSASVENNQLWLTVKLNRSEKANDYLRDLEDGTQPGNSIGFYVHQMEMTKDVVYNKHGEIEEPAEMTAIDWELVEISAVDIPAIPNAGTQKLQEDKPVYDCKIFRNNVEVMPSTSKAAKTAPEPETIPAVSPTGDTQQLETLKAQLAESQSQIQALTSDKELLELKTKFFQLQVSAHEKLTTREITPKVYSNLFGDEALETLNKMSVDDFKVELRVIEKTLTNVSELPSERLSTDDLALLGNKTVTTEPVAEGLAGEPAESLNGISGDALAQKLVDGIKS